MNTRLIVPLILITALSGCGGLREGYSLGYVTVKDTNSLVRYDADGGVVISNQRMNGKTVCVAPPPSVGSNQLISLLASIEANGDHPGGSSAALNALWNSSDKSEVVKLFDQNEQTLLLQYSLYRLCEAYMNGMFDLTRSPILDVITAQKELALAEGNHALQSELTEYHRTIITAETKLLELELQKITTAGDKSKTDEEQQKLISTINTQIATLKATYHINTYQQSFKEILDAALQLAIISRIGGDNSGATALDSVTDEVAKKNAEITKLTSELVIIKRELDQLKERIIDSKIK